MFAAVVSATHIRNDQAIYRLTLLRTEANGSVSSEDLLVTPSHPFWVEGAQTFVEAAKLKAGDVLQSKAVGDAKLTVQSMVLVQPVGITYNLTVEEGHTFYVGKFETWVHNTGPCPHGVDTWEGEGGRGAPEAKVPTLKLSREEFPNHVKMLENAKAKGHSLENLERGAGTRAAKKNRYESQKEIRKQNGSPPENHDYDEFPYASTTQGGEGAHVETVLSDENQAAGRRLGDFYRINNIKEGDKFNVEITEKKSD